MNEENKDLVEIERLRAEARELINALEIELGEM